MIKWIIFFLITAMMLSITVTVQATNVQSGSIDNAVVIEEKINAANTPYATTPSLTSGQNEVINGSPTVKPTSQAIATEEIAKAVGTSDNIITPAVQLADFKKIAIITGQTFCDPRYGPNAMVVAETTITDAANASFTSQGNFAAQNAKASGSVPSGHTSGIVLGESMTAGRPSYVGIDSR